MQAGLFDLSERYALLEQLGDPLPQIDRVVDWEAFREELEQIRSGHDRSKGGRPPWDAVLMFKVLVVQQLYNLSDEQTEYQIRDRYSFSRFLGLDPADRVPDAKTIWSYREQYKDQGVLASVFAGVMGQIEQAGYVARKGQIVDAAMVSAPRSRNRGDENKQIRRGEVPDDWTENKRRQKDTQARWARKAGETYFGYKNHISVDVEHKLVRGYAVTDASCHDGHYLEAVLDPDNTSRTVWADANYRSRAQEQRLAEQGYRSQIQKQGQANRPLNERERATNRRRSKTRIRVEHVFAQQRQMGRTVRTIGQARAEFKIGMMNLVYNLRRWVWLAVNKKPKRRLKPA